MSRPDWQTLGARRTAPHIPPLPPPTMPKISNPGRAEILTRDGLYPVDGLGAVKTIRARWTGEKRPPRRGEYYLSGAKITAYKSLGDMSYPYHIAELVSVEYALVPRVVGVIDNLSTTRKARPTTGQPTRGRGVDNRSPNPNARG